MKTLCPLLVSLAAFSSAADGLPPSISVSEGPVNSISIERDGKILAINNSGSTKADTLLLTHARRDIVRAARKSRAARTIASPTSKSFLSLEAPSWENWWSDRFDYYKQQVTLRPTREFPNIEYLKLIGSPDGHFSIGPLQWQDLTLRVLKSPGYTTDAVTYLTEIDGKKVAFVGDLILAGGKVRDLYSFQNEIREAKVGGYHGHLGRLSVWIKSLEALAAEKPDFLIPSRGPASSAPGDDISRAISQARSIYRNYLSTNALHWYFGEERMNTCATLVLGENHGLKGMPFAEHIDLPDWCQHIGTTKLLVSENGKGFVLDVGGTRSFESLQKFHSDGLIAGVDGIFATHTHNDHTAAIADAADFFQCPVYALPEVSDVLENPGHWFLPGVSPNAVPEVVTVPDRKVMKWEEFTLTFYFYPGQMYNHGALLVEKQGHDPVFFIGDSFSPSGIDDYCLMNRNLMREDTGYALCFQIIEELPKATWLVNQHIPHLFRFSEGERTFLKSKYTERARLIQDFIAWDDVNYAIDEQWASLYPYGQEIATGATTSTEIRILNHSTVPRKFTITLRHPELSETPPQTISIKARESGTLTFDLDFSGKEDGLYVVTADVERDDGVVEAGFCETLIKVGNQ